MSESEILVSSVEKADLVFSIFEYHLKETKIRFDKKAKPITFVLLPFKEDIWSFHPKSKEALFQKKDLENAELRVYFTPGALLNFLKKDPEPSLGDVFYYEGDIDCLKVMFANMGGKENPLSIRF